MASFSALSSRETLAVVLERPAQLKLTVLPLSEPTADDVMVDMEWSAISTGTERLLWNGAMPAFPGLGYPLVPGYESVGRISRTDGRGERHIGERVFVPGARCFGEVRGLFGGAAARVVVPASRVTPVDDAIGEHAVLLALAATAHHALTAPNSQWPDLIIGHGVLGRLLARLTLLLGERAPLVWEKNPQRALGAAGYRVVHPDDDKRHDYQCICDASGDATQLDALIARLAPGGELVLAGFYGETLQFAFPAAFMREVRLRVSAEWRQPDLLVVKKLAERGVLDLNGLITHRERAQSAAQAYHTAFTDPSCLKMVLDWRTLT